MTYAIGVGDTAPPLVVTATDAAPISAPGGWRLRVVDAFGVTVMLDESPTVDSTDPASVIVTHAWVAGETDEPGDYGVEVETLDVLGGVLTSYPASPLPFTIESLTPGGGVGYCTIEQARAAGAVGTDTEVTLAIMAAGLRVDRYTGQTWAPTTLTVATRVGNGGVALLGRRVRTVSAVTAEGATAPLAPSSYRVTSSSIPGDVDAVVFGAAGWADPLIAGAEPWAGGWDNLLGRMNDRPLHVTGSFGYDSTPSEITEATAVLASWLTNGAGLGGGVGVGSGGLDTDDEGNAVRISPALVDATAPPARTTGSAAADILLSGYTAGRVRIS